MKKGTNYFSENEIFVSNGSKEHYHSLMLIKQPNEVDRNISILRFVLNAVRTQFGKPIIVNSWLRSPEQNKKVGGVSNSHHLTGAAADIRPQDSKDLTKLYNILHDLFEYHVIGELIKYPTFIHVALYD